LEQGCPKASLAMDCLLGIKKVPIDRLYCLVKKDSMEFNKETLFILFQKVKLQYEADVRVGLGEDYVVNWETFSLLNPQQEVYIDPRFRDEHAAGNRYRYTGKNYIFPKIKLDGKGRPMIAPWSILGCMNRRLGERRIDNELSALAKRYLNPLLDLSENDRLLSGGRENKVKIPREKADLYAQYAGFDSVDALLRAEEAQEVDDYRGFFFSNVRYDVWDKGRLRVNYRSKTVTVSGFYQNQDIVYTGAYSAVDNELYIHLEDKEKNNRLMMIAKVNGFPNDFGNLLKAAALTVSTYPGRNLVATEVLLVKDSYWRRNPSLQLEIRQYLMLQRARFMVYPPHEGTELMVHPAALKADILSDLSGIYQGVLALPGDRHIWFSLRIDAYYRAVMRLPLDEIDHPYLLCYLELSNRSAVFYVWIRAYAASPGPAGDLAPLPRLGQAQASLQLVYQGGSEVLAGAMSLVTGDGLLAGGVRLRRTPEAEVRVTEGEAANW